MTSFTPLLIATSLYEVIIERMEYDDTFHTFSHCDLIVWSISWGDGVWWHRSYLCSLWPHCMKYLLRWWSMKTPFIPRLIVTSQYEVFVEGWSMMTPFIPLLIVTSLYEVFIEGWNMMTSFIPLLIVTSLYEVFVEGMEYDNIFHISAHCDLIVWSICWGDGVRWHLSYLSSLRPHSMKYLLRGWSTMTPFIPLLIVTSLTEVFIEGMKYDDTFHTSAHCDLTDRSIYWGDGVRWHLSYLCSLWPHWLKYLLRRRSTMTPFIPLFVLTSLNEVFIERMEYDATFHTFSHCDLTDRSIYWGNGVRWHLSYLCSLWPHWQKYLLRGWSTMTPFIPLLIVTSLTEVLI